MAVEAILHNMRELWCALQYARTTLPSSLCCRDTKKGLSCLVSIMIPYGGKKAESKLAPRYDNPFRPSLEIKGGQGTMSAENQQMTAKNIFSADMMSAKSFYSLLEWPLYVLQNFVSGCQKYDFQAFGDAKFKTFPGAAPLEPPGHFFKNFPARFVKNVIINSW